MSLGKEICAVIIEMCGKKIILKEMLDKNRPNT